MNLVREILNDLAFTIDEILATPGLWLLAGASVLLGFALVWL